MLNGDVAQRSRPQRTARPSTRRRGARAGTLALIGVEDPSAYGLVRLNEDRSVKEFLEESRSPDQIDTNLISAGAYVLEARQSSKLIPPGHQRLDRARRVPGGWWGERALRLRR